MVGNTPVDVLFAPHPKRNPTHGLNWLEEVLGSAQRSIDMALFVFSAQQLADVLQEQANQGIRIRLIADPGFASRSFSECWISWGWRCRIAIASWKPTINRFSNRCAKSAPHASPVATNCITIRRDR